MNGSGVPSFIGLTALQRRLIPIQNDVGEVMNYINTIRAELQAQNTTLQAIANTPDTNATQNAQISALQQSVTSITTALTDQVERIGDLEDASASAVQVDQQQQLDIDNVENAITTLTQRVDSIEGGLTTTNTNADTTVAQLNDLKYQVDLHDLSIDSAITQLYDLTTAQATYATKTELEDYYDKTEVDNKLLPYLKTADASATYATKTDLTSYPTSNTVSTTYATKAELQEAALGGEVDLTNYVTTAALTTALDDYTPTNILLPAFEQYYLKSQIDLKLQDYLPTATATSTYMTQSNALAFDKTLMYRTGRVFQGQFLSTIATNYVSFPAGALEYIPLGIMGWAASFRQMYNGFSNSAIPIDIQSSNPSFPNCFVFKPSYLLSTLTNNRIIWPQALLDHFGSNFSNYEYAIRYKFQTVVEFPSMTSERVTQFIPIFTTDTAKANMIANDPNLLQDFDWAGPVVQCISQAQGKQSVIVEGTTRYISLVDAYFGIVVRPFTAGGNTLRIWTGSQINFEVLWRPTVI